MFWFGVNDDVTVTSARARTEVPAIVPSTVNLPGAAYCDGSTASHVTGTICVTSSVYCSATTAGRYGGVPTGTTGVNRAMPAPPDTGTTARAGPPPLAQTPPTGDGAGLAGAPGGRA